MFGVLKHGPQGDASAKAVLHGCRHLVCGKLRAKQPRTLELPCYAVDADCRHTWSSILVSGACSCFIISYSTKRHIEGDTTMRQCCVCRLRSAAFLERFLGGRPLSWLKQG